jgi:chromosome segregation ATPase
MDECHSVTRTLVDTTREIETARQQQAEAFTSLEDTRAELKALQTRRDSTAAELAGEQKRLADLRETVSASESNRDALKQQIEQQSGEASKLQQTLAVLGDREKDLRATLDTVGQQSRETQSSLESLQQAEKAQRKRHDDLLLAADSLEKEHAERQQALAAQAAETQQKIDDLETRFTALDEWHQRMQDGHKRLADLQPESLEARNIRNDIEMSMASMRHLLSSRARVVFPPSANVAEPARPANDEGLAPLQDRLSRLREAIRQEEARLESLRQPSSTHETRAARITGTFTMPDKTLREQDRRLEDKIRVNEARLELLEARLRRGEEDEKCQREKILTLKQQLVALAQGAAPQK